MYYQLQNSKLLQSACLVNLGVLYGSRKNCDYFSIQRFTTEPEFDDCAVRTESLYIIRLIFVFKGLSVQIYVIPM